ncbi:MAG: SURF1 family protein [Gammaproteobacteria bacterium]|nr:SURF1 family protein [Gammaproteobacteria bacterium]
MPASRNFSLGHFHIRVNWIILAAVLMSVAGLLRLSWWQLERAGEKVDAQRELEARLAQSAPAIEEIPRGHLHRANPELPNRHVTLNGEYENGRNILVLAEFFDNQIGYGIVTPFRLAATGELVLIERGWRSGIGVDADDLDLRPVSGPVSTTAQIHVPPDNARILRSEIDPEAWPLRVRSLEIDVLSDIFGEALFPFSVRLTEGEPGVFTRHWPAVSADSAGYGQNLSYALQWFAAALIVSLISLLASSNLWSLLRGPR